MQATWSDARRANALARDFTVNALMLDPFSLLLYDYTRGVRDCMKQILRAIGSPAESFKADPARIFRAIRHAARCSERLWSP
jgi:poly(A) polymerase